MNSIRIKNIFLGISLWLGGAGLGLYHPSLWAFSRSAVLYSSEHFSQQYEMFKQRCMNNASIALSPYLIQVDVKHQKLTVIHKNGFGRDFSVSTSKHGLGQIIDTERTPMGLHRIQEKIGEGVPLLGIFHHRKYTGKVFPKEISRSLKRKDFIVTRIFRLQGLEVGLNQGLDAQGRNVDSEKRGIFIHGTTMPWMIGRPNSRGCIYMDNADIVELFNMVPVGTLVWIS